jgi:recombination protein RecR
MKTIMIIEKETDLLSLEKTGKYRGRYFIVGAMPKTGIIEESQKARVESLKGYIRGEFGQADELILGFNPSTIGDFHATLFAKEFKDLAKKISRLGRGLPTGGEIEFADDETLGASLERRS